MKINDPMNQITEQQVAQLCQLAGLPKPELIEGGQNVHSHIYYGMRFPSHTNMDRTGYGLTMAATPWAQASIMF